MLNLIYELVLCHAPNSDSISLIDLVTIVIALFALFVSVYTITSTIKHNKLSVKPIITQSFHVTNRDQCYVFSIKNIGVGPAIVEDFKILHNNHPLNFVTPRDMYEYFKNALNNRFEIFAHQISPNDAIAAGDEIKILRVKLPEGAIRLGENDWLNYLSRICDYKLEINYKSVYNVKAMFQKEFLIL